MKIGTAQTLAPLLFIAVFVHAQQPSVRSKQLPVRIINAAHTGDVLGIFISKDDSLVASCGQDGIVKVWLLQNENNLCSATGHISAVNNLSISGDDRYIASASNDRTIRIWSTRGCTQSAQLSGHQGDVLCIYFSQSDSGHFIVSGSSDRTVKLWDWQTGAELKTFRGHRCRHRSCLQLQR